VRESGAGRPALTCNDECRHARAADLRHRGSKIRAGVVRAGADIFPIRPIGQSSGHQEIPHGESHRTGLDRGDRDRLAEAHRRFLEKVSRLYLAESVNRAERRRFDYEGGFRNLAEAAMVLSDTVGGLLDQ